MVFRILKMLWSGREPSHGTLDSRQEINGGEEDDDVPKKTQKRRRLTAEEIAGAEDLFEQLASLAEYKKTIQGLRATRVVVTGIFEHEEHMLAIDVSAVHGMVDEPGFSDGELSISWQRFDDLRTAILNYLEWAEGRIEYELGKLGFDPALNSNASPNKED